MTENNNIEIQSKEELKKYFETGDTPNQHQYAALIDSLAHEQDLAITNIACFFGSTDPYESEEVVTWKENNMGKMLIYQDGVRDNMYYYDYGTSDWSKFVVEGDLYGDKITVKDPKSGAYQTLNEYLKKQFHKTVDNIDIVDGYLKLTTDTSPRKVVAQISIKALKKALDEVV